MTDIIQVQTTTDQESVARKIADELVDQRLAACVQIGGPITSVYRWQGHVETSTEWTCAIKTLAPFYAIVEQHIRQLHNYEEPEIIATPVSHVSAGYDRWLRNQLAAPGGTAGSYDQKDS